MASVDFIQPKVEIQKVPLGKGESEPRTSLDFIIRQNGAVLNDQFIRIEAFSAQDSISQLFEYQVSFRANDQLHPKEASEKLDFSKIVGCSSTVRIGLPQVSPATGKYPDPRNTVFFNGIVSDISFQQTGSYVCTLRPALWRLSLVNDYRQFSQMTIKEVIEDIVKTKWGLLCDCEGLGSLATYRTQDWMQMGETDWDFIQNLLQQVGGFYYFIHDDNSHTVVFANNPGESGRYVKIPPTVSDDASDVLCVFYTYTKQDSYTEDDYLLSFNYQQKLVAPGVRNIIAEPQSAWEENATADLHVYTDGDDDRKYFQHYRVFQFGSSQELASTLNKEDEWAIESSAYQLSGESNSAKFKPGHIFQTIMAKPDAEADDLTTKRSDLDKQRFVIQQVTHTASVNGQYSNKFVAAPAKGNVHELHPASTHIGSMLGRVVSKNDQRAAYKNHWMLDKGKLNFDPIFKSFLTEQGSPFRALGVYVEFPGLNISDQPIWIKLSENMTSIPEAGVIVMVDRSRDDTNVPQISFVVEQKGNKTILPNGTNQSTRIGDDYSTSYGDNRSISFGASSEVDLNKAISKIDGEYASGDFKSASYSVGGNYAYEVSDQGRSGVLSKRYSKGATFNESHGDSHNQTYADNTDNYSKIGTSIDRSEITKSRRTTTIGSTSEVSAILRSDSSSAIGISTNKSITGETNSINVVGKSSSISAIASNLNINAVGLSTDISATGGSINVSESAGLVKMVIENGVDVTDSGEKLEARIQGLEASLLSGPELKV